jgi:hypothetical protein
VFKLFVFLARSLFCAREAPPNSICSWLAAPKRATFRIADDPESGGLCSYTTPFIRPIIMPALQSTATLSGICTELFILWASGQPASADQGVTVPPKDLVTGRAGWLDSASVPLHKTVNKHAHR